MSRFTNCAFIFNRAWGGPQGQTPTQFVTSFPGSGRGGAIFTAGATEIVNSTIAQNVASGGTAFGIYPFSGDGVGGGLFVATGSVVAIHCTIASNVVAESRTSVDTAGTAYGGAFYVATGAVASIQNTLIAAYASTTNCWGPLTDLGGNLASDESANLSHSTSINNADPMLAPLLDFGGPTPTMALLEGSPAIDAAYMTATPQPTDQRGRARPTSSGADIGAFESAPPWSLHGQVVGNRPTAGMVLQLGGENVVVDAGGRFSRTDLPSGNVSVVAPQIDWITLPVSTNLNLTRDVAGVDFEAYLRGTVTAKLLSPQNTIKITYAPPMGAQTYVDYSTNLTNWTSMATNPPGLTQWLEPVMLPPRYFRFRPSMLTAPAP